MSVALADFVRPEGAASARITRSVRGRRPGISERNTVGILEGSFPDVMLVKQIGEAKWEPGRVDLLGICLETPGERDLPECGPDLEASR